MKFVVWLFSVKLIRGDFAIPLPEVAGWADASCEVCLACSERTAEGQLKDPAQKSGVGEGSQSSVSRCLSPDPLPTWEQRWEF